VEMGGHPRGTVYIYAEVSKTQSLEGLVMV
jgi:hypothetical protein